MSPKWPWNVTPTMALGLSAAEILSYLEPHFAPPDRYQGDYGPYRSPLTFESGKQVETRDQWMERRAEILNQWHAMLGPWPALLEQPRVKILATESRETFTQYRVHVEIDPDQRYTEGHLLIPAGQAPFPAVLVPFYDSHTSVGLTRRGRGSHDYGVQLARRGFVTLSIGTPGSIERPDADTRELLISAGERYRQQPLSYLAYAAANCHTALTALAEVNAERIGIVGLSYGGKWAMFASSLYEPFACAVWSDAGIVFDEKNRNVNYWEPWYLGYEPGVCRPTGIPNKQRPRTGLYKRLVESRRDLNDLQALMCPRPLLVAGGRDDPPRHWRALNHLVKVNMLLGQKNRIAMTSRRRHFPCSRALNKTLMFLEYFLKYGD